MYTVLNKCPICGNKLEIGLLHQYENIFSITSSGKMSKTRLRKEDVGPMECSSIRCVTGDFATDFDWEIVSPNDFKGRVVSMDGTFYIEKEE